MKKLILIVFIFVNATVRSQIINTESLRMVTDTLGWTGSVGLDVSLIKNTKDLTLINNKIHVQYKADKHLVLFINKIGFNRIDGADFVNKGVQHLRYNYKLDKSWVWEVFLQNQYNTISKIDYRRLVGSGVRVKLSKQEKYKVYLGSLFMYENEKTTEEPSINNRDWRNSSYLSYSLYFNDNISLISTTYYQPKLEKFSDYRVAHQSTLVFKIIENLSFKTSFNYNYDANPVIDIPKTQYSLLNGIVYNFE